MTDVSCRLVLDHIEFLEKRGLEQSRFFRALHADIGDVADAQPDYCKVADHWVSWRTFAAMCRVWEPYLTDDALEAFLESTIQGRRRWISAVAPALQVVTGPRALYWVLHAWARAATFKSIRTTHEDLPDRRIRLTIHFRPGDEPIPLFNRMTPKMLAKIPRVIGYPEAVVETETGLDRTGFTIIPPYSRSLFATVLRHVKAMFAVRSLTTELAMRDQALREAYVKLLQARAELETKVEERTTALAATNALLSRQIEALRNAEKLAHIGRWDWELATGKLTWSDETYRIFGVPVGQDVNVDTVYRAIPAEEHAALRELRLKAMRDRAPFLSEHRVVFPDGEIRHVSERGEFVLDRDGTPVRMVGTVHDITLQKRYEASLIAAKESADAANSMKSAFLANMSHEIRTPMCSVLGFAELLASPSLSDERRHGYAAKILRNGRHLLALIDDALDLAKIEAGRLKVAPTSCSPAAELYQTIDVLKDQAEAKGLRLALELIPPFPRTISTDPIRLRQILLNVIGNALKFTSRGGVSVKAMQDGVWLTVFVRDTGLGIAPAARDLLFQPFSQVPGAPRHSGSGLGLALARRLARALGGDVVLAESTPSAGSLFVVTVLADLPEAPRDDKTDAVATERAAGIQRGTRILVVEDTDDIQELLKRVLEIAGAEVTVANDGAECLDLATQGRFDLVLLDMHMPRVSGYEAAASLRRGGFSRPIIALTAYAMPSEREKCFAAGCDDFLAKPVETRTLLKAVARWAPAIESRS